MVQDRLGFSVKTFIFQNQNTYHSENLEIPVPTNSDTIDIRHIVDGFKERHSIFMRLEWKIYDPKTLQFKIINVEKTLNPIYFYSPVIMLKYRELGIPDSDSDSLNSKGQSETKKERNKERTIREVIECVKRWRQVHNTLDKYKNKINLYDAAKEVGIAKKSLDDYFCQLRLAEEYGFNFQQNINQKIGVLRAFVRKHRPKGEQSVKHERLPKKLRVIQEYDMSGSVFVKPFEEKEYQDRMLQEEPFENMIQSQYEPPMGSIAQDELQHKFYNSFNYMIEDPTDPFINNGFPQSSPLLTEDGSPQMFFF